MFTHRAKIFEITDGKWPPKLIGDCNLDSPRLGEPFGTPTDLHLLPTLFLLNFINGWLKLTQMFSFPSTTK